jgi:arylsulfatase A-like enzyme
MKGREVNPLVRAGKRLVVLLVSGTAISASLVLAPARGVSTRPPNVLIIVTDDQRARTLKNMPRTRSWFKLGGTSFLEAYATTPLCCPSRASIFTGRYVHNHKVKTNRDAPRLDMSTTLHSLLQNAGYRTALFGKFLNGWDMANNDPPFFDEWASFAAHGDRYYDSLYNVNGRLRTLDGYSTDVIAQRAVRFLSESEDDDRRPWLMYVTPVAPHFPYLVERDHRDAQLPEWRPNPAVTEANRSDKPQFVQERVTDLSVAEHIRSRQLRTLLSVDELVDKVMDKLDALDEDRNTLAFYMSDNGYLWGEHGLTQTSAKRTAYTASVRIPLLVRWPGKVADRFESRALVATVDVAPTVLQAAGVAPAPLDGRSLLAPGERDRILLEYWADIANPTPEWASLRTPTRQYTEYYGDDKQTVVFRELYDLEADPWQLHNLLATAHVDVTQLEAQLAADRRCAGATCP